LKLTRRCAQITGDGGQRHVEHGGVESDDEGGEGEREECDPVAFSAHDGDPKTLVTNNTLCMLVTNEYDVNPQLFKKHNTRDRKIGRGCC